MSDALLLSLLCGLVSWRIASLLHTEDAFEWLRKWIGIEHDEERRPILYPETFWGRTFHCFWCLSLAVALPVGGLGVALADVPWAWFPFVFLASNTIAIWTEKQILRAQSREKG